MFPLQLFMHTQSKFYHLVYLHVIFISAQISVYKHSHLGCGKHYPYLSAGDISSGLDTQANMTGRLTGYEELCSCLSRLIPALTARQRELQQSYLDGRSQVQTTGVVPCSRTLPV